MTPLITAAKETKSVHADNISRARELHECKSTVNANYCRCITGLINMILSAVL